MDCRSGSSLYGYNSRQTLTTGFYRMYDKIEELEEQLIAEIQIYEERKPNGQRLKSVRFKLPFIENDLSIDTGRCSFNIIFKYYL